MRATKLLVMLFLTLPMNSIAELFPCPEINYPEINSLDGKVSYKQTSNSKALFIEVYDGEPNAMVQLKPNRVDKASGTTY